MKLILLMLALYATTFADAKSLQKKPTNASATCANQPDGMVLKHATDCNKFILCIHHNALEYSCRPGEYFDADVSICLPIENTPQHKCSCIMPEHTVVMNPEDCTTFYYCESGKAVMHRCPIGQFYDERISACLVDVNGICVMQPTRNPAEMVLLQLCQYSGKESYITQADPSDCSKFLLCMNGKVFTEKCDNGFYYDKYLHFCRLDTDNICIKSNITKIEKHEEDIEQQELLKNIEVNQIEDTHDHTKLMEKPIKNLVDITEHIAAYEKENQTNIILDVISDNVIESKEIIKAEVDSNKNSAHIDPINSNQNVINKPVSDKLYSKFINF
ncbi:peritrophin-48 isoform X2 [Teleopsis dalmanni]|uniref:peritrophin-48 isoform X2 n=2 Tax=Teleopsis dalmanni TaxID=139649 RepID=UPI0018CD248F|nr:peritrophin-48 isoform X2 [Teleopsis dalmanni]